MKLKSFHKQLITAFVEMLINGVKIKMIRQEREETSLINSYLLLLTIRTPTCKKTKHLKNQR